jgi:4-diphosphocytidyl-2-C-methyl-D-erythritol kinase
VVRVRYPEIGRALDWLNQYGIARLTGTGACVFAAFNSSEQAHQVLTNLPNQWQGFVAQGKNVSPLLSGIVAT